MVINIKRPLVGAFVFLLAGICTYLWAGIFVLIIIFLVTFLFYLYKFFRNKKSIYFVFFPFIILIGYGLSATNDVDYSKGEYVCEIEGTVDKVQKSTYGYKFWLKDDGVIVYSDEKYNKGDKILVKGMATPFENASNPGGFNTRNYYKGFHIGYMVSADEITLVKSNGNPVYTLADKIKGKLTNSFYTITDEKHGSVFSAMLLGDKDDLDEDVYSLFSSSGIGHVLAISGLHISIIGMGLYKIIRRMGAGYVPAMIICAGIILFYGVMTGNGVSTIRAIIMFLMAVYANVVGRTYDLMSAACFAGIVMLMESPFLVYNGGFILSFGAIAGIGVVNPVIMKVFEVKRKVVSAVVGGLSIQLATVPVIMYVYFEIPIYSVILNLVVVPLMTYVMIFALAGGVCGCFNVGVGQFMVAISVYILDFYEKICVIFSRLPMSVWTCGKPKMWQMLVYYAVLGISLRLMYKYGKKRFIIGILISAIIIILRFNNSFEAYFLDVGQGDGIFIRSGNNTFLVDGGSSDEKSLYDYSLEPFLLSKGVSKIDYVVVTHPDSDHMSGILDMMEKGKIKIGTLVLSGTVQDDEAFGKLYDLAYKNGADVMVMKKGDVISDGKIRLKCIHPGDDVGVNDRNDTSLVLHVTYKDFSMLLTGDISDKVEKEILKELFEVDLLKVAHHGSGDSTCMEFLEKTKPSVAVISCGEGNSYGHPHGDTIERLLAVDAHIRYTMKEGAIVFAK